MYAIEPCQPETLFIATNTSAGRWSGIRLVVKTAAADAVFM